MTGVLGLVLKMNEMKRPSFLKSTNKEVDNKCPMARMGMGMGMRVENERLEAFILRVVS